jgi:hypothetical protein
MLRLSDLAHPACGPTVSTVQRMTDSPRYIEAYPRISIGDALRGRNAGTPDVLWRNRLNHVVGVGIIDWPDPSAVIMRYHIQDLSYLYEEDGEVEFSIVYKGSTPDNLRPYATCEGCTRVIDIITFAGREWRCNTCLRLYNRSTLIDPVVRATEELEEIERTIGNGRPHGMRMKRFEALEHRYLELKGILGRRARRNASKAYTARISAEWLPRSLINY